MSSNAKDQPAKAMTSKPPERNPPIAEDTLLAGLESRDPRDATRENIGPYRLVRVLGEGGMGKVYQAEHVLIGRTVALKIIRRELAEKKAFADRFLAEARLVAQVDHPNVITLYDAAFAGPRLYMAVRYLPNGDVGKHVMAVGSISEEQALSFIAQAARGLQAIHERGLVHRDIKPGNLFLDDGGRVVVGDLGLAATMQDLLGPQTGPTGTPSYMSPEQVRGQQDLDIRSDIYSLGMTLFTILTRRTPFGTKDVGQTLDNVLNMELPHPRVFRPSLSDDTIIPILRALQKDRNRRFQTPGEFADALDRALGLARGRALMGIPEGQPVEGDALTGDLTSRTPSNTPSEVPAVSPSQFDLSPFLGNEEPSGSQPRTPTYPAALLEGTPSAFTQPSEAPALLGTPPPAAAPAEPPQKPAAEKPAPPAPKPSGGIAGLVKRVLFPSDRDRKK